MYDDRFTEGLLVGSNGYNNNNNGWNDWSWIIALALIGGLFNNGGFGFGGFGGGRGAVGGELAGWQLGKLATTNDVASGFSTAEIMSDLNDIILGQAQMQNFINQGFAGLQTTITSGNANVISTINSGFAGVDNAICTLGYQNQAGFNALSNQLAQCCCDTRSAIADVKYANERNTCDIIRAGQDNTRAILDYLTGEKISSLQAENSGLKAQISNDRQSKYLIDALGPKCPVSAYIVQPPQQVTFPTNCCGNVAYANYNGCGASVI